MLKYSWHLFMSLAILKMHRYLLIESLLMKEGVKKKLNETHLSCVSEPSTSLGVIGFLADHFRYFSCALGTHYPESPSLYPTPSVHSFRRTPAARRRLSRDSAGGHLAGARDLACDHVPSPGQMLSAESGTGAPRCSENGGKETGERQTTPVWDGDLLLLGPLSSMTTRNNSECSG